jgi:hypothetical protein
MLTKLAELYNRQDIVDGYKYGVFNYIDYFDLLSRFKIYEYKAYQVRIIKRRSYAVNCINIINRVEYYIDNILHRDNDKPAIEWSNGRKEWLQNGKLHRDDDRPASEYASGSKEWWQNGELHRDNDKPAVEYIGGTKWWFQNGKQHRDNDKPAIEHADGRKEWWQNDVFIRSSKN